MNRKIFNYFEIAAQMAKKKDNERAFILGSVGIRADGVLVKSSNASAEIPNRFLHAEYKILRKLDTGATIYVARVKLCDGSFGLSKPCHNCMKAMKSKRVYKVYYTISDNEYGVIYP
jgi:tRNA(Arg) A34 adenosine deaminase TadA